MRCPYCRTRLAENSPECPSCRLTLERASALLGPVPRVSPGLSDLARVLTPTDSKRVNKAASRLMWAFPQLSLHILLHKFPTDHPFDLHVFWLFNCGSLFSDARKGGDNHGLLLALDPAQGRSALMAGYGLEPFLGDEALEHLLELSEPAWQTGEWARGIVDLIQGLERLLESAALEVANGFGLEALHSPSKKNEF